MKTSCPPQAADLRRHRPCLTSLSKDVDGRILRLDGQEGECRRLDCRTPVVTEAVTAALTFHDPCDPLGRMLDGRLSVGELVTAFDEGEDRRGVHAGEFRWTGPQLLIAGRLDGISHADLARPPQVTARECAVPGVLSGRLYGRIEVIGEDPSLVDAAVTALYHLRVDGDRVTGIVEGVVLRACDDEPPT